MISKHGFVAGNTWSKHENCFRKCPIPFLLIRWCPRWLNWGGSTTLSTPLKWRRYCDSLPIAVCDNIRIRRSKIYTDEKFRGYTASKKRYLYGLKIHLMVTHDGQP